MNMGKNNYPLWLRIALKLPLRWKHKIRHSIQMLEYGSQKLVIDGDLRLVQLIENTRTPDFETFDRELDKVRKRWKIHDPEIESMAVRARFLKFKYERMKVEEEKT